jgi:hypothetical protein
MKKITLLLLCVGLVYSTNAQRRSNAKQKSSKNTTTSKSSTSTKSKNNSTEHAVFFGVSGGFDD